MSPVVLKLRITGTAGAYRVFAQLGDEAAEGDLGLLPDNFREQLDPVCTENLSSGVVVVKSAKDGV
jgi:hypothetical protein